MEMASARDLRYEPIHESSDSRPIPSLLYLHSFDDEVVQCCGTDAAAALHDWSLARMHSPDAMKLRASGMPGTR